MDGNPWRKGQPSLGSCEGRARGLLTQCAQPTRLKMDQPEHLLGRGGLLNIFPLEDLRPAQPERGRMRLMVLSALVGVLCMSVLISVAGRVYRYVYVTYMQLCVCVPTGDIFSALLLVGPGGMEWWQPCLSRAARSGPIPSQNPFPPLRTGPQSRVEFINAAQALPAMGPGPQALP